MFYVLLTIKQTLCILGAGIRKLQQITKWNVSWMVYNRTLALRYSVLNIPLPLVVNVAPHWNCEYRTAQCA